MFLSLRTVPSVDSAAIEFRAAAVYRTVRLAAGCPPRAVPWHIAHRTL